MPSRWQLGHACERGQAMVSYQEFGLLLTAERVSRGLSRLEVAIAVCVDPSFYARVERGLRMVSLITFALLWRNLKIDAGPLLAALPVEVAEPNKRQRQRTRPGKASRAELACLLNDFDGFMARARNAAGLTQQELAYAVGLSRRHIGRIESGYGLPSLPAFAHMHRVLGFDPKQALGRLVGFKSPVSRSGRYQVLTTRVARPTLAPRVEQTSSSRLWRDGPLLSVSVRDDWRCLCREQGSIAPGLAGIELREMPMLSCIGSVPVAVRLQDTALELPFLLLSLDTGEEIEIRQPGLDGSLDASNATPSAFMATLYGSVVATCGLDVGRLRSILRVAAYVDRQCLAYIRGRGLATPHD